MIGFEHSKNSLFDLAIWRRIRNPPQELPQLKPQPILISNPSQMFCILGEASVAAEKRRVADWAGTEKRRGLDLIAKALRSEEEENEGGLEIGKGVLVCVQKRIAKKKGLQVLIYCPPKDCLMVPLGCVTPFALINNSARNVTLLLDQGFKAHECCFFHPLSNDITISLNARELDKFLLSIGKTPSYVDLEATPTVGKDQPPDLAALVPSAAIVLPDQPNQTLPSKPTVENHVLVENKPKAVTEKTVKQSSNVQCVKKKAVDVAKPRQSGADVRTFIDEIIEKTSSLVLSQITAETIQQHGEHLGNVVSDGVRKRLSTDLERITTMFKNSAYTEGFHSGAKTGYVRGCPP